VERNAKWNFSVYGLFDVAVIRWPSIAYNERQDACMHTELSLGVMCGAVCTCVWKDRLRFLGSQPVFDSVAFLNKVKLHCFSEFLLGNNGLYVLIRHSQNEKDWGVPLAPGGIRPHHDNDVSSQDIANCNSDVSVNLRKCCSWNRTLSRAWRVQLRWEQMRPSAFAVRPWM